MVDAKEIAQQQRIFHQVILHDDNPCDNPKHPEYRGIKVLVCGDREWTNYRLIVDWLRKVKATTVVHGGARGADRLAGLAADELRIPTEVYYPDWARYGRAAGPIRNRLQYDKEQPDLVLAFHPNLTQSKGTRDMVRYAHSQGCRVRLIEG